MKEPVVKGLVAFAVFVVVVGVIAYSTNPAGAKTALISGGGVGGLMLLWALLAARGARWALSAALGTVLFVIAAFGWRASVGWADVAGGDPTKLTPAVLISAMLVAALALLPALVRAVRRPARG